MRMLLSACLWLVITATYAEDKPLCPLCQNVSSKAPGKTACPMLQNTSEVHNSAVDLRGDHAMGFSHKNTKHHFKLLTDGGIIEVDANDKTGTETRDQIRQHLTHIASMFSADDFGMPMFIHDTVPPGVPIMKEKHRAIAYTFMPTKKGGMVRIVTHDPDALKAIHDFLAFQIKDHRTGDSVRVEKPSRIDLP